MQIKWLRCTQCSHPRYYSGQYHRLEQPQHSEVPPIDLLNNDCTAIQTAIDFMPAGREFTHRRFNYAKVRALPYKIIPELEQKFRSATIRGDAAMLHKTGYPQGDHLSQQPLPLLRDTGLHALRRRTREVVRVDQRV